MELCLSPGRGGLELYMCRTVEELAKKDRVVAIINGRRSLIKEVLERSAFPYVNFPVLFEPLPLLAAWRLARLIDRERIQALHVHWRNDLPLAALAKRFSRSRPRLLYTRQMKISHGKRDPYHNFLYGQVDGFLAITRQLQEQLRARLDARHHGKIRLLYYGTNPPPLLDPDGLTRLRKKFAIPPHRFVIGIFAQVFAGKGQHLLIEALGKLRSRDIRCTALIVGAAHDAAYPARLRAMAEALGVKEQVIFVDFLKTPQELMQLCDVVVLATPEETFGLVLIEAMSVGTAVVGSAAGGVLEIIEDQKNGLLFQPGDAGSLSQKLATLYHDRERTNAFGREGARMAAERFSSERHYETLRELMRGD